MKKLFLISFLLSLTLTAFAQKITFTPQWLPQAQFAGYYLAKEKGFYEAEGLDVTIKHFNANFTGTVLDFLSTGESQIVGQQMLQAMVARSDGRKIVNIFQLTQQTGLMLVGTKPLNQFTEVDGLKVGRWKAGFSEICEIFENASSIKIDWIPFITGINLFVFGAVDATLCYSYSEYINLILATGSVPEEYVIRFSSTELNPPEDGLYVTEDYYNKNKESVDKFVRASKKGWDYARSHPEEALSVVLAYMKNSNISTNETLQRMMLEEYLKLQINPSTGKSDYAPVSREKFGLFQDRLLSSGLTVNPITYDEIIK